MSCSVVSIAKNDGFTEIVQLEKYDEKIELIFLRHSAI